MGVSSMIKRRFFVVGNDEGVKEMVRKRGHIVQSVIDEHTEAVIFTGGEDVSPFLYGEPCLPGTQCNIIRDLKETAIFKELPSMMNKIGICRGAQLLNVLSGGSMWQDVGNHASGDHLIRIDWQPDEKKRVGEYAIKKQFIMATSTHHQMMIPCDGLADVWASARISKHKIRHKEIVNYTNEYDNDFEDPEVIYYWHNNTLCFQPHPEYEGAKGELVNYFWECVDLMFPKGKTDAAA